MRQPIDGLGWQEGKTMREERIHWNNLVSKSVLLFEELQKKKNTRVGWYQ